MPRKKNLKLETLLNLKPRKEFEWFGFYSESLELFWQSNTRKAVTKIGDYISQNPNSEAKFPLYRLWLECLAMDEDSSGLVALKEHLFVRSSLSEAASDYLGLIGLIQLNLDEFEAAELTASAYDKTDVSVYMAEFFHSYCDRLADHSKVHIPFIGLKTDLWDYFSLRCLCAALVRTNYKEELELVFKKARSFYGQSPLYFGVKIERFFQNHSYTNAIKISEDLAKKFSKNRHFKQLYTSLLTLQGERKDFLSQLNSLLKQNPDTDDYLLANWCLVDGASLGFKSSKTVSSNLEGALSVNKTQQTEGKKVWMTFISDSQYDHVVSHRGLSTGIELNMRGHSKVGDWVFFAKKGASRSSSRVLGIYQIKEKTPVTFGASANTFLESLFIFEKSIEMDIQEVDQKESGELYAPFGVNLALEVDDAGLDAIFDEMEDQLFFDGDIVGDIQTKWAVSS